MSSIIVGSNEHAEYIESLRSRGAWPPMGLDKASPLPASQEVHQRLKAKKYRGHKVKCFKMCCQTPNTAPPPQYFEMPVSYVVDEQPYTGWTTVGKSGKTNCRPTEYLTDDRDDLLE